MPSKFSGLLPAVGLLLLSCRCIGQPDELAPIVTKFRNYQEKYFQEKIYVHTDKAYYQAGELCWFKLYTLDAGLRHLFGLERIAYVELLDVKNQSLIQAKIRMNGGIGNGSFYIPVSLSSGNYKFRAYTSWMKNFSADYFFEKTISIINTRKIQLSPQTRTRPGLIIHFFPEGGNLVAHIQSRLAFKITDAEGRAVNDCHGVIVDGSNDTVARFQPLKFGMGNLEFLGLPQQHYRAFITSSDGRQTTEDLPRIYDDGMVMRLEQADSNQLSIVVKNSRRDSQPVYLLAHTGSSLKISESSLCQSGQAVFKISTDQLGDGVSNLTILNTDKQPVCERLYFKYSNRKLVLKAQTNSLEYAQRERIDLGIRSAQEDGKPAPASLSMSVYRLDSLQNIDQTDIQSYLQLVSDLKGNIDSAYYYFEESEPDRRRAMDNLLLTQGWRRFLWEDIINDRQPGLLYPPECRGHIVTGLLTNSKTGLPDGFVEAYLSVPGTKFVFASDISDSLGRIQFEVPDMEGNSQIILQSDVNRDSLCKIEINNPFAKRFSASGLPALYISRQYASEILDQHISMQVQNIYVGSKLHQAVDHDADSLLFYKKPNSIYLLDNYTRFSTMEEVLREYVSDMMVRKRNAVFFLPLYNLPGKQFFNTNPLLLLDGVPIFDINRLMDFDPLKIRKLEVVNARYFLGKSYFDGIMSFTTYSGDLNGYELDRHAKVIDYEGAQWQREFYSPVYETAEQRDSHLPDFRNVLYWAPEIVTDANGVNKQTFYSSDLPGKYAALIQGVAPDGRCGSTIIRFEVK